MQRLRQSPTETAFSLRAKLALRAAFAAIKTEALATFLFNLSPRVPSDSFSNSIVLTIDHELTHSTPMDPRRAFSMPGGGFQPRTEHSAIHLVLTPVKTLSGALVGVVSVVNDAPVPPSAGVLPFSAMVQAGIHRGRFVFDVANGHLVCVMDGLAKDNMGVVSTKLFDVPMRERYFFAIPRRQYSFDDMPTMPLVIFTNQEYRVSEFRHSGTQLAVQQTAATSEFESLRSLAQTGNLELSTQTQMNFLQQGPTSQISQMLFQQPGTPWHLSRRQPESLTKIDLHRFSALQKRDAFDMSDITNTLEKLQENMSGVFYGPNMKRDVMNVVTGELTFRASGKILAKLAVPDSVGQRKIKRMVAQDYFLRLLPPGSERWFIRHKEEDEVGEDLTMAKREISSRNSSATPSEADLFPNEERSLGQVGLSGVQVADPYNILSRVSPSKVSNTIGLEESTPTPQDCMMEDEKRKMKLEDRRIRNRLSAARSNERRKARETAQKRELQELRTRKGELLNVERRLMEENMALKKLMDGVFPLL